MRSSITVQTLLIATLAATLSGCPEREVARLDLTQSREQEKEIPIHVNRDLDILFVIDNSFSMLDEQESLVANFDRFINVLGNIEGGLPNLHIGVVSTDLGAGPFGIMGCTGNGDNGNLINSPAGECDAPSDRWISDIGNADGSRSKNYQGEDLAATFSCIARLGVAGCGFEQPLEAMRRALNGSNAANSGFLRKDAFLAVIIITDEDDCSVEDVSMFDSDPAQDRIDSELGFLDSFRCFDFGVQCDPDTPRSIGPRQDCTPREDPAYMYGVEEYAHFLKGLKEDPGQVLVAGIIGNPSPVVVGSNDGEPVLEPSCSSSAGEADPAVRISAFLDQFPQRSTTTTICNEDLSDALTIIADDFIDVFGTPCMQGKLKLTDGEPACTVSDVRFQGQDWQEESMIPLCDPLRDILPCYRFELDPQTCSNSETQLSLIIERGNANVPLHTTVVARCIAEG